jgi:hypothetical protein
MAAARCFALVRASTSLKLAKEGQVSAHAAVSHSVRTMMDENNPVSDVRQVERLLYSRIAASHDRDSLATEEEAVACRAGRHTESDWACN